MRVLSADMAISLADRVTAEFPAQPSLREPKVMTNDVDGTTERLGCLLRGHASEVPHLNQLCERFVLAGQRHQSAVQLEKLNVLGTGFTSHIQTGRERDSLWTPVRATTAFPGSAGARIVHKYLPHHPGDNGHEV